MGPAAGGTVFAEAPAWEAADDCAAAGAIGVICIGSAFGSGDGGSAAKAVLTSASTASATSPRMGAAVLVGRRRYTVMKRLPLCLINVLKPQIV